MKREILNGILIAVISFSASFYYLKLQGKPGIERMPANSAAKPVKFLKEKIKSAF